MALSRRVLGIKTGPERVPWRRGSRAGPRGERLAVVADLDCRCGVLGLRSAPNGRASTASVRCEVGTVAKNHHVTTL